MVTGEQPQVRTGDALEFLRELQEQSVQVVVTDPPYQSINKWRSQGSRSCRRLLDWFPDVTYEYLELCLVELYRVLEKNSHCYIFGDWETLHRHVYPAAERAGFKTWPPLVWDKASIGLGYHYRPRTELVAFLEKGKRPLASLSVPNLLRVRAVKGRSAYPTEKPVELVQVLLAQSSVPGDVVLDPFCGSGAVGVAALGLGRRFLGADVEEGACEHARAALAAGVAPHELAKAQGVVFRERRDRKALRPKPKTRPLADEAPHEAPDGLDGEARGDATGEAR
jgi:site-specific DNA-methyltransferase (adenine-specific)